MLSKSLQEAISRMSKEEYSAYRKRLRGDAYRCEREKEFYANAETSYRTESEEAEAFRKEE